MQGDKLSRRILQWELEGTPRREEPKKEEWLDGIRQNTNKHGLTEGDAKKTVKKFGRKKTLYSGHYLNR